jgi:UDP-N-acetylmuramoyl-tripeptide--D-alanyl-D-alanine ligase
MDLDQSPLMLDLARSVGARTVTFGAKEASDWRLKQLALSDKASTIRASHQGRDLLFKVLSPGRHFAMNGLGALAAADALGLDLAIAATDLGHWTPPAGRGQRERILLDPVENVGFDLIDDAFNANPASLSAALDMLIAACPEDGCGRLAKGRRIAILGDMLELGPTEMDLHRAVARHPGLSAISVIHCAGPRMRALHDILPRSQRGEWAETAEDLAARARSLVDAGDIVLVKGSKGAKVSRIVDAFRKLGPSAAARDLGR